VADFDILELSLVFAPKYQLPASSYYSAFDLPHHVLHPKRPYQVDIGVSGEKHVIQGIP
jgi:hypothetical protein